jgi:cleavage and polyadenylation specificity factor subunit 1
VDNEDDLLYGDAPTFQMPAPPVVKPQENPTKKPPWYI